MLHVYRELLAFMLCSRNDERATNVVAWELRQREIWLAEHDPQDRELRNRRYIKFLSELTKRKPPSRDDDDFDSLCAA
jgi:hypothetical protein